MFEIRSWEAKINPRMFCFWCGYAVFCDKNCRKLSSNVQLVWSCNTSLSPSWPPASCSQRCTWCSSWPPPACVRCWPSRGHSCPRHLLWRHGRNDQMLIHHCGTELNPIKHTLWDRLSQWTALWDRLLQWKVHTGSLRWKWRCWTWCYTFTYAAIKPNTRRLTTNFRQVSPPLSNQLSVF